MALKPNWTLVADGSKSADNLGSTQYIEMKGSGSGSSNPNEGSRTRIYSTNYDVFTTFMNDLLGYHTISSSNTINRVLPDADSRFVNYYAQEVSYDGYGKLSAQVNPNDQPQYSSTKLTAVYRPVDYAIKADSEITTELDRYVSRYFGFEGDYETVEGNMKLVGSGSPPVITAQQPGVRLMSQDLTYVWHWVPSKPTNPFLVPNLAAVNSCFGCINSTPFDVNNGNYPAGTILFAGIDPKIVTPRVTAGNQAVNYYWEISLKFQYRNIGSIVLPDMTTARIGWNYKLYGGKWYLQTWDGTQGGQTLYNQADLNTLFTLS